MADEVPNWAQDTSEAPPAWAQGAQPAKPSEWDPTVGWNLQNLGRSAALTARAPLQALTSLASLPFDAVTQGYDYAKSLANGRKPQWSDIWSGFNDPSLMSSKISSLMTKYGLPEPRGEHWYSPERLAFTVDSLVSGSKMPIPGMGAAGVAEKTPGAIANISPEARAAAQVAQVKANQAAMGKVQQAMQRDGLTFEQASQKVAQDNAAGVPTTLADVGPNTTTTAEVLAQRPGEAQKTILDNRLQSLQDTKTRVPGATREAMDATVGDPGRYEAGLSKLRAQNARENYSAVRGDTTPVMDPDIWHLLENPQIAALYQKALDLHGAENSLASTLGKPMPRLAEIYAPRARATEMPEPGRIDTSAMREPPRPPEPNAPVTPQFDWVRTGVAPDVRTLDYLQRAMDDQVGTLYRGGQGQLASLLSQARRQLVNKLADVSPAFKTAFKTYAGDSEMIEAHDFGKSGFMNMSPGAAADYIKGLSESGKNALRAGAAESLLATAEKTGRNVNIASSILGGPRRTATLSTLFDKPEDFAAFKAAMEAENKLFQNTQQITRGSQTFRRAAASEDFDQPAVNPNLIEGVKNALHIAHGNIIGPLLSMMAKRSTWNPQVAAQTAKLLTSSDPARAAQELQLLSQSVPESAPGMLTRGAVAAPALPSPAGAVVPVEAQHKQQPDQTLAQLADKYAVQGHAKGGKVGVVMHEFGRGALRSGSKRGPVVRDRKQAIAIALSEQRKYDSPLMRHGR